MCTSRFLYSPLISCLHPQISYEWVTTPAFKPSDPVHKRIKKDIEVGDGLPDITDGAAVSGKAGVGVG